MLLRQFIDDDLGCASYLVADPEAGEAVVVDPAYVIEPYLTDAVRHGVRIVRVLETHTHADHVSGHGRLALEEGIPVAVHGAARAEYPHDELHDGDLIEVGDLRIRVVHTSGHRPEHCCFLAQDALLTGDSLFVGSAARPDLAVEARTGAEQLFHSLRRLLELRDDVRIFPGHVAGSLCGTSMSSETSSTIGAERRGNAMLAIATAREFVDRSAAVPTPRPPNMERIVELNRGPLLAAQPPVEAIADGRGATVVDVRPAETFAAGHVPGAFNIPVDGSSFGTKAGFVLHPGERIVLHASSPAQARAAAQRLQAVGLLEIDGYLEAPTTPATLEPIELAELEQLLAAKAVEVIDVREPDERDDGYMAGSRHIPLRLLRAHASLLANGRTLVTICESGPRAAIAASVLAAAGHKVRPVLRGGILDLRAPSEQRVGFRRRGS